MYEVIARDIIDRTYEFYIESRNGKVKRAITFYRTGNFPEDLFDIHLYDLIDENEQVTEPSGAVNVHRERALTIMVRIVQDFFRKYPAAIIHCVGANPRLERRHQIAIAYLQKMMRDDCVAYGRSNNAWQIVDQQSCFHEHLLFRRNHDVVPSEAVGEPEVNYATAEVRRQVVKSSNDRDQRALEKEYFYCFMHLGFPEPLQQKFISKRGNEEN